MDAFIYEALPHNVYFGSGKYGDIKSILSKYGYNSAVILTTPNRISMAQILASTLDNVSVEIYPYARMHVPIDIVDDAIEFVSQKGVNCCIALGGGSAIGLAKAIALRTTLPVVAIPTTYSGSEMTPIYGYTEKSIKVTGRDPSVLPKVVVYDPMLTLTLPKNISACSGMNAMAHSIEALYAKDKNPLITLAAIESIKALREALPNIIVDSSDIIAREKATYGSWLAGMCLGSVGMAIHHKICHVLGGKYDLPHAQSHAIMLPYSVQYNRHADVEAMDKLAEVFEVNSRDNLGLSIFKFNQSVGITSTLKDIGLPESGIKEVARSVCESSYYNPRSYDYDELEQLLRKAYLGLPPL